VSTNSDLYVVPMAGGAPTRITANLGADNSPQYSPNGKHLAYRTQLRAGYESDRWRLVVVERSPKLAHHLRQRFKHLRVIQGDAAQLGHLLGHPQPRLNTIVSSLPLRSLHPAITRAVAHQFETLLEPSDLLVQFTYDLRGTQPRLLPGFQPLSSKIVWSNLPPARVEVFERV